MKANYGPIGAEVYLRWQNGAFTLDEPRPAGKSTTAKAKRKFMELLRLFAEQGRRVNAKGGPNYAPTVFAAHPQAEGLTKQTFRIAMEELFVENAIRNGEEGPPSKRVTFLEVAGAPSKGAPSAPWGGYGGDGRTGGQRGDERGMNNSKPGGMEGG